MVLRLITEQTRERAVYRAVFGRQSHQHVIIHCCITERVSSAVMHVAMKFPE